MTLEEVFNLAESRIWMMREKAIEFSIENKVPQDLKTYDKHIAELRALRKQHCGK